MIGRKSGDTQSGIVFNKRMQKQQVVAVGSLRWEFYLLWRFARWRDNSRYAMYLEHKLCYAATRKLKEAFDRWLAIAT